MGRKTWCSSTRPGCSEVKATIASPHGRITRRRPSARARGYGTKWEKERDAYLAINTQCVTCGKRATTVDHKTPHRGNQRLFWSRSNWQPMCASCHSRKTARQDGGFGNTPRSEWVPRTACDDDGRPINAGHWWNGDRSELFEPRSLRPSRPELTIVSGAPAAGKSQWVRDHAEPEDLVIDVDSICAEILGQPGRVFSREIMDRALEERNRRLAALADDGEHARAFFIVSAARGEVRRAWATRLGARRSVLVMTPLHICLRRFRSDPMRAAVGDGQRAAIERWFKAYTPWVGDEIIRHSRRA